MDFSDALRAMRNGQNMARKYWLDPLQGNAGAYAFLARAAVGGQEVPALMVRLPNGALRFLACSQWDILADDWQVVNPGAQDKAFRSHYPDGKP